MEREKWSQKENQLPKAIDRMKCLKRWHLCKCKSHKIMYHMNWFHVMSKEAWIAKCCTMNKVTRDRHKGIWETMKQMMKRERMKRVQGSRHSRKPQKKIKKKNHEMQFRIHRSTMSLILGLSVFFFWTVRLQRTLHVMLTKFYVQTQVWE